MDPYGHNGMGTEKPVSYTHLDVYKRQGWICADKKLIHHFSSIRQLVDLHSCCISQQIVERFIVNGEMEKYVESIRREYRERRDMMADALKRYACLLYTSRCV